MTLLEEREHSKFPASGSERYLNCAASVELEEMSPPSKDTIWSLEGTQGHELFDARIKAFQFPGNELGELDHFNALSKAAPLEMRNAIEKCFKKVVEIKWKCDGELFSDIRTYQAFIHPEMFGTLDVSIVAPGKVLHIIDLKYGKGHIVSPMNNTQLIQYALGEAHKYEWNFPMVVVHIMQPRAGKNWHKHAMIPMTQLKRVWLPHFKRAVEKIEHEWTEPTPGNWCYWCRAKTICSAKKQVTEERVVSKFEAQPLKGSYEKRKHEEIGKEVSAQEWESANGERKTKKVNFGKL